MIATGRPGGPSLFVQAAAPGLQADGFLEQPQGLGFRPGQPGRDGLQPAVGAVQVGVEDQRLVGVVPAPRGVVVKRGLEHRPPRLRTGDLGAFGLGLEEGLQFGRHDVGRLARRAVAHPTPANAVLVFVLQVRPINVVKILGDLLDELRLLIRHAPRLVVHDRQEVEVFDPQPVLALQQGHRPVIDLVRELLDRDFWFAIRNREGRDGLALHLGRIRRQERLGVHVAPVQAAGGLGHIQLVALNVPAVAVHGALGFNGELHRFLTAGHFHRQRHRLVEETLVEAWLVARDVELFNLPQVPLADLLAVHKQHQPAVFAGQFAAPELGAEIVGPIRIHFHGEGGRAAAPALLPGRHQAQGRKVQSPGETVAPLGAQVVGFLRRRVAKLHLIDDFGPVHGSGTDEQAEQHQSVREARSDQWKHARPLNGGAEEQINGGGGRRPRSEAEPSTRPVR